MSALDLAEWVTLFAGVAVMVCATLAMFAFRWVQDRLHTATAVTSLGLPLVGVSLALRDGFSLTTAGILLTVFFVAASGPVLGAAVGRLVAQREGAVSRSQPE